MRRFTTQNLIFHLLIISSLSIPLLAQQVLVLLSNEDIRNALAHPQGDDAAGPDGEWDDLGAFDMKPDYEFDPGSWRPLFEEDGENSTGVGDEDRANSEYYSALSKMIASAGAGDPMAMDEASSQIEAATLAGNPHAQSLLGFLHSMGLARARDGAKALLYHHFAADGGNVQSKLALAYTYFRQEMYDKSVSLYAELAELAVNSFMISKDSPLMEAVRIHSGTEETKLAKGEEDEEFQIMEYEAERGNAEAMHHVGLFHFYGLRGLRRDHKKAFSWFVKAAVKGEPNSMEILAEIYARGIGVERNYSKALEWLQHATKLNYFSAYNGMGYLYVKGHGVEKNLTKAKEFFKLASEKKDAGGLYNLGIMHLKGIGVKKDPVIARQYFISSANKGQPKAFFQLAKMFHKGIGMNPNLPKAVTLYKLVAERGPWSSMSRWALESYAKGDLGKALLLYMRLAELGFEVAQSNAAWILDKYGDQSMCLGESSLCTDSERYQRAHILWWQASEQGNEHAGLLIGDAYYYGRGTERDYVRAAEAYMQAKSQANAQAMFNLGYMHEHGEGLTLDLHLAKRYYDEALETDPAAKFPVTLALASLWLRQNYADSFLVDLIDSLPYVFPKVEAWVDTVLLEEGNVTILTLCACLMAVLFLRERQRRQVGIMAAPQNLNGQAEPIML
ncbi:hypothetical protein QQ045_006666 [Rhodiola kirilowii]